MSVSQGASIDALEVGDGRMEEDQVPRDVVLRKGQRQAEERDEKGSAEILSLDQRQN